MKRILRNLAKRVTARQVLVSMMVAGSVMYGGSKGKARQGIRAITRRIANVQPAGVEFFASNWNMRGAWRDSMKIEFENGWVFPHGSNHLESVEVMAWGEVRTRHDDTNAIASIGMPLAIVPGLTVFAQELTPSNSYRFAWTDAAAQRDTNTLVSAAIELMRNGDVIVTVDGEETRTARRLPFDHDGYGQDDDWIRANFANATEIIAKGYTNWVDGQVGTTANGMYRFTVSFSNAPPETVNLTVGDKSVAIDSAGDYSFVLEKGARYGLGVSWLPPGVAYSYSDGVVAASAPHRAPVDWANYIVRLTSTGGGGGVDFIAPSSNSEGYINWQPTLSISPETSYDPVFPIFLRAIISDVPHNSSGAVTWKVGDAVIGTGETISWQGDDDTSLIEVVAAFGDATLYGSVVIERHLWKSEIYLLGLGTLLVEDSYTNAPDEVIDASSTDARFELVWSLAEDGVLKVETDTDVEISDQRGEIVELPYSIPGRKDSTGSFTMFASCTNAAHTGHLGNITFSFTPDDESSEVLTSTASIDVVKIRVEAEADWPSNKVRHVFGPMERFSITSAPQVSLSLPADSTASIDGNTVTSPDRCDPFAVTASYGGASQTLQFYCLEPEGLEAFVTNFYGDTETQGKAGDFTIVFEVFVRPTYVCFDAIEIKEKGTVSTNAVGYFANSAFAGWLDHSSHGAGEWNRVNKSLSDEVGIDVCNPPWGEGGSFSWLIPNLWRIAGRDGMELQFCETEQKFEINAVGTVAIRKFDCVGGCMTNRIGNAGKEIPK